MPINISPITLLVTSLTLSSVALAEDARITCTGTVASVVNGGVATQPFANATVGDAVSITFDVEIGYEQSLGTIDYHVNWPTSSISIGSASAGVADSEGTMFLLSDDLFSFDQFQFQAALSADPSTTLQLSLMDSQSLSLNSQDVRDLYGTTFPLAAWTTTRFRMESPQGSLQFTLTSVVVSPAPGGLAGTPYCAGAPNTTGDVGTVTAYGLQTPGDNDLTLTATGLPTSRFGYFIASQTQGLVVGAGGSSGNLCLGGSISRLKDQIARSNEGGQIVVALDLGALPSPAGPLSVQAGETWNFQLWHRDFSIATGVTSNFTEALAVTFQ
ncbi:hypothetical protein Poly30_51420 [Planctomycetes bacterium Poly30]|uniref:Uncharacterized protein n=1 Tax=Saltatorellus ferox TaxID=2528018 RepID=A0A518EZS5_9BACT|nr:hypothetical protein Poly30_51420 [Planctomycetes bacterium Poly30]